MSKNEKSNAITRGKIRAAIINNLKSRGIYRQPYADRVERYMALWDTVLKLEDDIEKNGIKYITDIGTVKKNESVSMLNQTNKQMDSMLEKLGINGQIDGQIVEEDIEL